MFGWLKKASKNRVLKTMDALAYLANLTTAHKINSVLKASNKYVDEDELNKKMAVRTNYLFGKEVSDSHFYLDLKAEFTSAIDWLSVDSLFRELVVQSLRVMNTSKIAKGEEVLILGEDILNTYGYLYPENSSPDDYKTLVFKAIDSLPSASKNEVIERANNLGLFQ